jgi:hypothetical protein
MKMHLSDAFYCRALAIATPSVKPASFMGIRAVPLSLQAPVIEENRDNVFD